MNTLIISIIGMILGILLTTVSGIAVNTYKENEKYRNEHIGIYLFVIFILIIGIIIICASIGGIAMSIYWKYSSFDEASSVLNKFSADNLGDNSLSDQQVSQSLEKMLSQSPEIQSQSPEVTKPLTRSVPRSMPRSAPRSIPQYVPRYVPRSTPRPMPRSAPRAMSRF